MSHKIILSRNFYNQLHEMDPMDAILILSWMRKHLEQSTYPALLGQRLTGNFPSLWRYRVGHYRIITKINDPQIISIAVESGYRKDVILSAKHKMEEVLSEWSQKERVYETRDEGHHDRQ